MGSNRTLRHRRDIRHLNSHLHGLYCELTRCARQIRQLSEDDIMRLDEHDAWNSLTEELIDLPAYLSMRAAKIMANLHRSIWDIIEVYDGDAEEPMYLFEFFNDVIMKYRLDLSTPQ